MKNVLIVVDMQKDFVDGALGTAEAVSIVGNVAEKIRSYPAGSIIATRDTHAPEYMETQEGKFLPVIHCVKDTPGWEIVPEVAAALGDAPIVDKPTFGSTELAQMLTKWNEKEPISIELVGLCTDICVISNALLLKAFMPEVPISVDASCCAGVTPATHEAALASMKMCQISIH